MPDQVLTRDGPAAVPMDYKVPQGGELIPLMVTATLDGTSAASPFYAAVQVIAPSGRVMGTAISESIAAGASASVTWFPGAEFLEAEASQTVGVTAETVFYDSVNAGTPLAMSTVLASGVSYVLIVEGTWSLWNEALNRGTPESEAQFPDSHAGRVSWQVGLDAETLFAYPSDHPQTIGHTTVLSMSLDNGSTYSHIEPVGGPYTSPEAGHLYRYELTGQGHALRALLTDVNPVDNYGQLRFTLQVPSGTGTGSGAGSLVPPSDTTLNGDVLTVVSGVPAWAASAGAGITSLASPGSTITVTNPAGPTADVDLPATGVTAAAYGDSTHVGQFTVDAEGRLSAAASIAISGLAGAGFTTLFDSTLGVAATAIDTGANGIAQTTQHLLVVLLARTSEAVASSAILITFNGDTAANYDRQTLRGTNATAAAAAAAAVTSYPHNVPGASVAASHFATLFFVVPAYRQTTAHKIAAGAGGWADTAVANSQVQIVAGNWRSTAAINQLTVTAQSAANLVAGSRLTIFGLG